MPRSGGAGCNSCRAARYELGCPRDRWAADRFFYFSHLFEPNPRGPCAEPESKAHGRLATQGWKSPRHVASWPGRWARDEALHLRGGRRLAVANGLHVWRGAQVAVDTTLVSPLHRDGQPRPRADTDCMIYIRFDMIVGAICVSLYVWA